MTSAFLIFLGILIGAAVVIALLRTALAEAVMRGLGW